MFRKIILVNAYKIVTSFNYYKIIWTALLDRQGQRKLIYYIYISMTNMIV